MKISTLLFILITICIISQSSHADNRIIMMSKDYCPNYGTNMWEPSKGCAVITQDEVTVFEKFFDDFLLTTEENHSLASKWKSYYRQYMGRYSSTNQKLLYLNAFCDSFGKTPEDLKHIEISVDDGGDCFFQIVFNIEKRQIETFMVNGVA